MRGREHLTRPEQYALVYKKGSSWVSDALVMKAMPNGLAFSRYGLSVGRRVGNAVVRNLVKRRLREIMREQPVEPAWDILLIARTPSALITFAGLERTLRGLLSRAGILAKKDENACLRAN
jgi:ribonuclease P protein component